MYTDCMEDPLFRLACFGEHITDSMELSMSLCPVQENFVQCSGSVHGLDLDVHSSRFRFMKKSELRVRLGVGKYYTGDSLACSWGHWFGAA